MIKAVYPGTFDPLTRGHEDLVRRASTLFDSLILAIADSKAKQPFFSLEERISMSREVLGDLKNVERCPCTRRRIVAPQRRQGFPSRS